MRNRKTLKHFHDDVILVNYDVTVIFPISCQFGAIRKPDSGRRICKSYIFINSSLLSYKSLTVLMQLLRVQVLFLPENAYLLQKICWHEHNFGGLGTKSYIFWNYICVLIQCLRIKFKVSSIILTSFRQEVTLPPHRKTFESLERLLRLGLINVWIKSIQVFAFFIFRI